MTEEEKYALEAGIEMLKELAPQIYEDGLHPAVKQVGEFCEDAMKTFRLIAFPIMLGRVGFHRFDSWCKRLSAEVDEKNMQEAQPNILLPTLAGLAINPDETLLGEMFFSILKSSIDKTRQKFLSPAFPKILEQLSKDEAVMLVLLKKERELKITLNPIETRDLGTFTQNEVIENNFPVKKIEFIENIWNYYQHMQTLGLCSMEITHPDMKIPPFGMITSIKTSKYEANTRNVLSFGLTDFGKHFSEACISPKCEEYI